MPRHGETSTKWHVVVMVSITSGTGIEHAAFVEHIQAGGGEMLSSLLEIERRFAVNNAFYVTVKEKINSMHHAGTNKAPHSR